MSLVRICDNKGKGRSFITLHETQRYEDFAIEVSNALSDKSRVARIEIPFVTEKNWKQITEALEACIDEAKIRQSSIVAFGSASTIAQHLSLLSQKRVRSLILVDAETRPHPGVWSRCVDWLEKQLPLGLPLRSKSEAFDGKPFLQRLRCPVMIVTSPEADAHSLAEANILLERLPISWKSELSFDNSINELVELAVEFQDVKAKCPQKAKSNRAEIRVNS
ncbi:MAG: hypothetical protein R3A13_05000 [Bdellovibrionota bacterium]